MWETTGDTALKVFRRPEPFQRELAAYQRLAMHRILKIRGHHVPQLLRSDVQLLALEITIVPRPFILDFGSAYLDDAAPQFPDEVMEYWLEQKREEFGADWPAAAMILSALKVHGIHLTDVHPGNIAFLPDPHRDQHHHSPITNH